MKKQTLCLLILFFLLFSLFPINIISSQQSNGIFLIETTNDWINAGFNNNNLPVYTPHALTDFYMPIALKKEDVKNLKNSDVEHTIKYADNNFNTRLRNISFTILENQFYYVVLYHMRTFASTKNFSIDFVPKIKGEELGQFAWWNSAWDYKKEITFESDQVSTDFPFFPVVVNISSDSDLASKAQNDGDDICFTDSSETTQLSHELETFDGATGQLVTWVNVSNLDGDVDTSIWMYYGNSGAGSQEDVAGTWDTDYVGIYHMNTTDDSSSQGNGLANSGADQNTDGIIEGCYDFENDNTDYMSLDTFHTISSAYTIEAWWYVESIGEVDDNRNVGIHLNDHASNARGIQLRYTKQSEKMYYAVHQNASDNALSVKTSDTFVTGDWYHIVSTGDTSDITIYLDGSESITSSGSVGFSFPTDDLYVGYHRRIEKYFDGRMDEVRISTIKRNISWITTTYNTMNNASDTGFFTLGIEYASVAPDPPTDFVATTETNGNINVSWTMGVNASHTYLERNTVSSWSRGDGTYLYNGTGTYHLDTSSLDCGTDYYYRGWSYNSTSNNFSTSNVSDNISCPGNPTNVQSALYDGYLNITWTMGTYADRTIIMRKSNSYPTGPTDGTEVYNNTGTYHNDSGVNETHYHTLYSWNSTTNTFSTGANAVHGSFYVNCYDENTSLAITGWDIFISNSDKTSTYESLNNTNTLVIDVADVPYGDNTMIRLNATGYNFRVYYMDLDLEEIYTLDAYLTMSNATDSYIIRVINELEQPVNDATVTVKRYINETDEYQDVTILLTDGYGYCPSVNLIPNEDYAVTISKTGYTTATYDLFPIPVVYTEDRYHTFMIYFSDEEEPIYTPQDVIDFTATINSDGNITVQYHDNRENTEDTQIRIYQYYNYTLTINNTNNRTNEDSFTWTTTGYNTSMSHRIRLWVNHSDFDDMVFMEVYLDPIRTGIVTEKTIEDRFVDVFGSWDLGYAKTLLVFLPCMMFLVVFGSMHVGLGIMSAGMYLGFSSFMINIEGMVAFTTLGTTLAVAGLVVILVKHGERRI